MPFFSQIAEAADDFAQCGGKKSSVVLTYFHIMRIDLTSYLITLLFHTCGAGMPPFRFGVESGLGNLICTH
jgi:hypothetical protein